MQIQKQYNTKSIFRSWYKRQENLAKAKVCKNFLIQRHINKLNSETPGRQTAKMSGKGDLGL